MTTTRIQLALNVDDITAATAFYTRMFGVAPHKQREGYANFAIEDPPLKLVLIETTEEQRGTGAAGALNHLGVEVSSVEGVTAARERFADAGLAERMAAFVDDVRGRYPPIAVPAYAAS